MMIQHDAIRQYDPNRYYSFVSYSSDDRDRILEFVLDLSEKHNIWFDKTDIHHRSTNWWEEAQDALTGPNCRNLLLFLSEDSLCSLNCFREVDLADHHRIRIIVIDLTGRVDLEETFARCREKNGNEPDGVEKNNKREALEGFYSLFKKWGSAAGADGSIMGKIRLFFCQTEEEQRDLLKKIILNLEPSLEACEADWIEQCGKQKITDFDRIFKKEYLEPITGQEGSGYRKILESLTDSWNNSGILLTGEGGVGKTYVMLSLMKDLLNVGFPCLFFSCRAMNEDFLSGDTPYLHVTNKLRIERKGSGKDTICLECRGNLAFFFDGFNEITSPVIRDKLLNWIGTLRSFGARIIVSSRNSIARLSDLTEFNKKALDPNTVKDILQDVDVRYDRLNPGLKSVLRIPMFLSIYLDIKSDKRKVRRVNTAAELMDFKRKKDADNDEKKLKALRDFARFAYELYPGFTMSENQILEELGRESFDFLRNYHIIYQLESEYTFDHEHFRDYWIADHIRNRLQEIADERGTDPYKKVLELKELLNRHHLHPIVLKYVGELTECNEINRSQKNVVLRCLDLLRLPEDEEWDEEQIQQWEEDSNYATVTSSLLEIVKIARDNDLIGMDLSGLNLKKTRLNGVRTCSPYVQSDFTDAFIVPQTFLPPSHQRYPTCLKVMEAGNLKYLISISSQDILISQLPYLYPVWSFPHRGNIISESVICGKELFLLERNVPRDQYEKVLYRLRRIKISGDGLKQPFSVEEPDIYPWDDIIRMNAGTTGRSVIVLRSNGEAIRFTSGRRGWMQHTVQTGLTGYMEDLGFTVGEGDGDLFLIRKTAERNGVDILRLNERLNVKRPFCRIGFGEDEPCCKEIGRSKYLNAGNVVKGVFLALYWEDKTVLYFISENDVKRTDPIAVIDRDTVADGDGRNRYNRVNACSLWQDQSGTLIKMLICTSDSQLFQFEYDPELSAFRMVSSYVHYGNDFSIDDCLYLDENSFALVTKAERSVTIYSTGYEQLAEIRGVNRGLRDIQFLKDNKILVSDFDGGQLVFVRNGSSYRFGYLVVPVQEGLWCWTLEPLSDHFFAAGMEQGKIAVVDIDSPNDPVREIISLPDVDDTANKKKIECLLYYEKTNTLFIGNYFGLFAAKIDWENGIPTIARPERIRSGSCFSMVLQGEYLLASGQSPEDRRPVFYVCKAADPFAKPEYPDLCLDGAAKGLFKSMRSFAGEKYLLCAGASPRDSSDILITVAGPDGSGGMKSVLTLPLKNKIHSVDVLETGPGRWMLAIVHMDQLVLMELKKDDRGGLKAEKISEHDFPARIVYAAFEKETGNLLISGIDDGSLNVLRRNADGTYAEAPETLCRHQSYIYIYGTDLSQALFPEDGSDATRILKETLQFYGNTIGD